MKYFIIMAILLILSSCCTDKVRVKNRYIGGNLTIIETTMKKPVLRKTKGQLCTPENIKLLSEDEAALIAYIKFLEWKISVYEKRIREEKNENTKR